jgi:ABC-2 type transport system permease protein
MLGLFVGNAQAASGLSFLVLLLSFASSALVPIDTMPIWLQPIAEHQPMTSMINTVRTLIQGAEAEALLGNTAEYYVVRALIWAVVIIIVFIPLASLLFLKR